MRRVIIAIGLVGLLFISSARADNIELNLSDLGCPMGFDFNSPYWQTDFDLGVTFTEITNVYIDWSGKITAGLAVLYADPSNPFPQEVGICTYFDFPSGFAEVWGGEGTYPAPEPFDSLSEIQASTWIDLLDGKTRITVQYDELIMLFGRYIEHGSVMLDDATLIVEGTIVPEPTMFLLLITGIVGIRTNRRKHRIRMSTYH